MLYWVIDFIEKGKIIDLTDYLNDQIIVYAGLYGIPSYCIWYMAKDKTKELYLGLHFRLSLIKYDDIVFYDEFIIKDAIYDVENQMYKVYAESAIFSMLQMAKGIPATIWTNNKSQPLSGQKILKDVIGTTTNGNIEVIAQDPIKDLTKYTSMSFDHEFSILDLITKICKENRWEWYLRSDKLYISNALVVQDAHVSLTEADWNHRNFINYVNFTNIALPSATCEPGASFEDQGRVVWVKYYVGGEIGDQMVFTVYNHKYKFLSEESFIKTLNGYARDLGEYRLLKTFKQFPIILGKVFNTPTSDNIDKYEAPTFGGDIRNATKDLNTHEIKSKYVGKEKKVIGGDNLKITTPYAGDGVGVQYPQQEGHAVLFSPNGEREFGLVGPRFFGYDETIPKRNDAQDYRLQLPGAVIYISKNGDIIIEQSADASSVPSGSGNSIKIDSSGNISINGTTINLDASGNVIIEGALVKLQNGSNLLSHATHQHMIGNMGIPIPPHSPSDGTTTTMGD